ncbi:uncharacterized protein LOC129983955 [Argiope bruennichi]|uniref:uncharacterized protein LOC129983955 n=1 Tax=Argiope bruennichi TaxID=94029 RepID=UPI002495451F|nr:uncharacterized protein LOC129983955 [Argiope bruennichi]XP_055949662.1 uncharacterized protein LOC129983955 [Argiope bruennichi]XP_055949663.1 uncharacterized protein LOC129983955 [Argiope bruennichi]
MLLYKEPRRIPTYMAAIIRRHRFLIIVIICFLILMTFSWHFHRKGKPILKSTPVPYVYESSYDEIQNLDSNKAYFSEISKMPKSIEEELPHILSIRKSFEEKEMFSSFQTNINKETTKYEVEEFIPLKQKLDEFTTKVMRQIEEKIAIGHEEAPTIPIIQRPEGKSSSPLKIGVLEDEKKLHLKNSAITFPNVGKLISLSTIQQSEEDFPPPNQDNKWKKMEHVTVPLARNRTGMMGMLSTNMHIKLNQKKSFPKVPNIRSTSKDSVLLIDTPGCKIPRLDPWDPTVKDLIEFPDPYVCPGPPIFLKSNPGGSITFNKTILETYYNTTAEKLICYYQPIYRSHEDEGSDRELAFETGNVTKLIFGTPLNEDYVAVSCNINGQKHDQYLPLVRFRDDVEEERNSMVPPTPALNVILIGIDSVSKLNFLRHFPRTHAFLNEKLKPFEMNGYTKVGDNTFPNLVPMLTGQFVEYWWNETVMDTMFFDNISLIWKLYAKRGYRTFYAEDNPLAGTFNYLKKGFNHPPTDYYFRPLALALEIWKDAVKPLKEFCLNSQLDFEMIYDYLKVFAQTMDKRPYFGFSMISTVTHDKLNNAAWVDEPTERLLEDLLNTGALNNTLLVLFSDHGLRFGKIRHTYVGKFEERLPLMYIHVPKWFLDQYPEIAKNLQTNQDRLMTLFDVHATMLHILDLSKSEEIRSMFTLGKSLFEEISPNRTCPDAYIQTHWCPCQEFDVVDFSSPEAINASQAIVDNINYKLQPYGGICEVLEVDTIIDARVGKANELMVQYLRTENEVINKTIYVGDEVTPLDDYMITLIAKPGGAVFEGTVRHNPEDNSYSVLGLSRISMYGNTSWCIDSQKMKIFCYCKIQQLT